MYGEFEIFIKSHQDGFVCKEELEQIWKGTSCVKHDTNRNQSFH